MAVGRVAGDRVAFGWSTCDRYTGACDAGGIVAANLRGRTIKRIRQGRENFVVDLELRADGSMAWTTFREGDRLVSVWLRRLCCRAVLVDAGTDIDSESLERDGATISWTRGGVRKSARFDVQNPSRGPDRLRHP